MAVNYPYYPMQQPQAYQPQQQFRVPYMEQPQIGIKGRPVSSIEEVKATTIDFDGSIFFFPDLANRKIYTKQINLDGTSTMNIYELKSTPVEPNPTQYVTREEFEEALKQLKNEKMALPSPPKQATTAAPTPVKMDF